MRARTAILLLSLACCAPRQAVARAADADSLASGAGADSLAVADSSAIAPPADSAGVRDSLAGSLRSTPGTYRFPTGAERVRSWAWDGFGPTAIGGDLVSAGWGQWVSGEPPEWRKDGQGFAKRFGFAAATTAITETSFAVLSAAFREDARYYRCPCTGLVPRATHALRMTLFGRRRDGDAAFSVSKTASPFVGPLVSQSMLYPDRYTVGDAMLSGAYAVLMNAGWNLAREFVLKAPAW